MNFRVNWDAMGIATSVACAIHCAVLPLVLTSFPVFGINIIDNVAFEYLMIFLAFAIGIYSLWHGYRKHHHSLLPVVIFSIGILLLVAKQLWHEYQLWLLPAAVLLIVTAHLINYRSCRVHNHAHEDDCDH
jgi:MerC mercury resistance protein